MKVTKMHGCGNDFCVIDYVDDVDFQALAKKMCNRKTGIGADGMIVVKQSPLEMVFYNADGSKAPMCGNGIRCFSKYAYDLGLARRDKLDVLTGAGYLNIEITSTDPFMCKVMMGKPIFKNTMLYVNDDVDFFGRVIDVDNMNVKVYSFFMGTVHTVVLVDSLEDEILNHAEHICKHKLFLKQTNVNFVHIIDKNTIEVKTFERGVGWTLACGTGCCASVVTTSKLKLTKPTVKVNLELGYLNIEVKKDIVYMTGPAKEVFTCDYSMEDIK